MLDLKRYERIKDAFYKKIEHKQEKLYLDDKNLNELASAINVRLSLHGKEDFPFIPFDNFDNLIFNGDPPIFYKEILKPASRNFLNPIFPTKSLSYSMGLFVLFFGTKTRYEEIAHHTIWLTERFKDLLHDIFEKRIITEDFSLYLHRPTATDKSFAPDGHDSYYVLCPVPNLKNNIDWSIHGEKLKDQIITELEKTIMPNLSNHIEDISYMTPKDFKNN